MADNIGKVVQVIGPVLDVEFEAAHLPEIYNALSLKTKNEAGQEIELVAEVQQHIGRGQVRAVSMSSTDGVTRGMDVVDTGASISVPVREPALGPFVLDGHPGGAASRAINSRAMKFRLAPPKAHRLSTGTV